MAGYPSDEKVGLMHWDTGISHTCILAIRWALIGYMQYRRD
jgi:hypothetical protein